MIFRPPLGATSKATFLEGGFFTDKNLTPGKTYYYRLKQIDVDGQFEYSSIAFVTIQGKKGIVGDFYPNPVNGVVQLDVSATQNGEWMASIYDLRGTNLQQQRFNLTTGSNQLTFDVSTLATGTYFVKLENDEESLYRKLIVE